MARNKVGMYGFVSWMATFVAFACYLLWAYLPTSVLHQLGVTYYPNKYWAITIPTYMLVALGSFLVVYLSINLIATDPLDAFTTITDEYSRGSAAKVKGRTIAQEINELDERKNTPGQEDSLENDGQIPPISDIPITQLNKLMYQDQYEYCIMHSQGLSWPKTNKTKKN